MTNFLEKRSRKQTNTTSTATTLANLTASTKDATTSTSTNSTATSITTSSDSSASNNSTTGTTSTTVTNTTSTATTVASANGTSSIISSNTTATTKTKPATYAPLPHPIGTNVFRKFNNASNAVGIVGQRNNSITSLPNKVVQCDQVILIPVKRLTNFSNYCEQSDAFFTMSAYIINLFDSPSADQLLESIMLDKLKGYPTQVPGAPYCLDFSNKKDVRLGICFGSKEKTKSIVDAFNSFMRCRLGDNLKDLSKQKLRELFELSCGGKRIPGAQQQLIAKLMEAMTKSGDSSKPNVTYLKFMFRLLRLEQLI
jgi:hypothetical protein